MDRLDQFAQNVNRTKVARTAHPSAHGAAARDSGCRAGKGESSRKNRTGEPVRLVIDVKRDADPELVLNQLYEFSPLQKTVSIIMLALVDGRPRTLTLKQMLEEFLRHRIHVIRRRTDYLLREAKRRGHIL